MLHWLNVRGKLPRKAMFCALPDFVFSAPCDTPPATDIGHAAASAMLDIARGEWHSSMLNRLQIEHVRLPRISPHEEPIGILKRSGRAIRWYPPVADQQCSLLGAQLEAGELSINISTGSQVGMLSDALTFGPYQTRPFFDDRYLLTNIHIPAGRSLNALLHLLTELAAAEDVRLEHTWANVERLARAAGPTDLAVDRSFFAGALGTKGAIMHAREDNLTLGHVFRAAFTSMAENYERFALGVSPGREWRRLAFSGGLALQSALLRELILARFKCASRLAEGGEDALVGLLAVALRAAGHAQTVSEARRLINSSALT